MKTHNVKGKRCPTVYKANRQLHKNGVNDAYILWQVHKIPTDKHRHTHIFMYICCLVDVIRWLRME